jgi:hypothetical protein
MAVGRFASLLDGLYEGWLDDPTRPASGSPTPDGRRPGGLPRYFGMVEAPIEQARDPPRAASRSIWRPGRPPGQARRPGHGQLV